MKKIFMIFTLGVAILAYSFYTPVPEEIKNPYKIGALLLLNNAYHSITGLGQKLGLCTFISSMRLFSKIFGSDPHVANDSSVMVIETTFDGVEVLMTIPIDAPKPYSAVIYIHGGGFVALSARIYFLITAELTKRLQVAVISINYRLAPEYPFPIPFQDCLTASTYLLKNAANYDISPLRISIAGDSAGGNLATAVALKLREHKDLPKLKSQVLIYPFLQAFDFLLPSYQQNSKYLLSAEMISSFALLYINEDLSFVPALTMNNHTSAEMKKSKYSKYVDVKHLPKRFTETNFIKVKDNFGNVQLSKQFIKFLDPFTFPLMADNLQELPPALVLVCRFDPLRDEGLLYAHRLKKAGNNVKEYIVEGGIHGSLNLFNAVEMGKETIDAVVNYLKDFI